MSSFSEPKEVLRLPDGRYVWEPALMFVEWIPKGKQRSTKTLFLRSNTNTFNGATRKAAQDVLKSTKANA